MVKKEDSAWVQRLKIVIIIEKERCALVFKLLLQKYHGWDDLNSQHKYLSILEAGESKIMSLVDPMSGEDSLPVSETVVVPLCPHMVEVVRKLSGVSVIKVSILP